MYVFGTCEPYFPSSLQMRRRVTFEATHRYQSPLFELPQTDEGTTYLECCSYRLIALKASAACLHAQALEAQSQPQKLLH